MKRSSVALLGVLSAGFVLVLASGCSDDDTGVAAGGAAGSSGKGGGGAHAGSGGGGARGVAGEGGAPHAEAGFGGGDLGGAPGEAGQGGSAGAIDAGSGGEGGGIFVCGPELGTAVAPTDIQVTSSAVNVAALAAVGTQTYTCQVTGSGESATYAWSAASVPAAKLYGETCEPWVTHYAGPRWKANDGSVIVGTKVRSVASASAASIPQLLLSAVAEGTVTGALTPVTAVQRLDTVGGVAPSTGCDAAHVNGTVAVPYTATYYFYSGASTIPPAP